MNPEIGRLGVRIATFTGGLAAILLFFLDRTTPEFAITVATLVLSAAFVAVVGLLVRRSK